MLNTFESRVILLAHVGWGLAISLILARWMNLDTALVLTFLFAVIKESAESLWGLWDKPKPPWSSAIIDTSEFCIGIGVAMVMLKWF